MNTTTEVARRMGMKPDLEVADIERLPYPDASFDTVTAACVFCSVGDPVRGIWREIAATPPGPSAAPNKVLRPRQAGAPRTSSG